MIIRMMDKVGPFADGMVTTGAAPENGSVSSVVIAVTRGEIGDCPVGATKSAPRATSGDRGTRNFIDAANHNQ